MADATSAHDLPSLSWVGKNLYCEEIETSWDNGLIGRPFLDVDGEAHDFTGRGSIAVNATLLFLNSIEPRLHPGRWNEVRPTLLTGTLGKFRHPEIGLFDARVKMGSYVLSGRVSNGIRVRVSWVESIKAADQPTKFATTSNTSSAAAAADSAIGQIGISYPDGSFESSFGEMVDSIKNFGAAASFEVTNQIKKTIGQVDAMHAAVQQTAKLEAGLPDPLKLVSQSPFRPQLEISLVKLRSGLVEMLRAAERGAAPTVETVLKSPTTLAAFSLQMGVDIGSLLKLNSSLIPLPLLPTGTTVFYQKAA